MNDNDPHAFETRPVPSSGGRLDRLFRLSNIIGVVTVIPAFFHPYLMMYFLLLLGIAVALGAFLLVIQMPVVVVARVIERTRTEQPRSGERFEI